MKKFSQNVGGGGTYSFLKLRACKSQKICYNSDMKHHYYKNGFTLAEVLITLAIIGVVAALTMPALLAHHQKQVLVTQLKKEYSAWSQAFRALLADEGVDKLSDTQVWNNIGENSSCSSTGNLNANCSKFLNGMQKYIKFEIPSAKEVNEYNGSGRPSQFFIKMDDGAILRWWLFSLTPTVRTNEEIQAIKANGGTMFSRIGSVEIDVNGYKKPNVSGRDIFGFVISDDGRLYPYYGKDDAFYTLPTTPLENNYFYWKNYPTDCETETIGKSDYSAGCVARIMENGWVMDY